MATSTPQQQRELDLGFCADPRPIVAPKFCDECGERLVVVRSTFLICPQGHGRLLPLSTAKRLGRVYYDDRRPTSYYILGAPQRYILAPSDSASGIIARRLTKAGPRISIFVPLPPKTPRKSRKSQVKASTQ